MGLDIIVCESPNWEESLRACKHDSIFSNSVDHNELFAGWISSHKGLYPLNYQENWDILNERLMKYCAENNLSYMEYENGSLVMGQIEDHIRGLDYFSFRSAYNENGVNNILRNCGLMDFYNIFDIRNPDIRYPAVDWPQASEKAALTLEKMEKNGKISTEGKIYIGRQLKKIIRFEQIAKINGYGRYRLLWSA